MENIDKTRAVMRAVPDYCPFCFNSDDVKWNEFLVSFAEIHYVDGKILNEKVYDEEVRVICTRCKEEILPEDSR